MQPIRIQRKRTKGWKMPENTVYVGRPTNWGNPFELGGYFMVGDPVSNARFKMAWCESHVGSEGGKFTLIETKKQSVEFFAELVASGYFRKRIAELRGKNLACWCKVGEPCHADILLKEANQWPTF